MSANSELLGIISRRTAKESRTIVTPVARIERLLPSRAQQGIFAPASAGRWFTGIFVTPFYTTMFDAARERSAFFGAGVTGGYHYESLFADFSLGIYQSSSRRLSASVDQTTDRALLELTAGAEFEIVKGVDGFFGPGLSLALDTLETTTLIDGSAPHSAQNDRARARPLLTLGFASGAFFCRDVFVLSSPGEARLDLGFLFGARNFQ